MAEWGLQAIIRPKDQHLHDDHFGPIDMKQEYDQALLFCYPHLFDNNNNNQHEHMLETDELNRLYKPFYTPVSSSSNNNNNNNIQTVHCHRYLESDQETQQDQEHEINNFFSGSASNSSQLAPKLKKRKNQQKRVVVQVTAAGLSSDPWAWRKYGQKPIKGSIYPRSYYRCSSSKGCMARRQVEQSCTDSSIYILTYTADHNHPQPTRRNSLAGINRNRFKATPKSPTNNDVDKIVTKLKGSPFHSPTTISASSIEDDHVIQQSNIKEETTLHDKCDDQGHTMMPVISDEDFMVFSDDFFEGLEDLGGYKMESSSNYYSSSKQCPDHHVFC